MIDMARLEASCRLHEGVRAKPYDDATGLPPILIGKLTVGIGRNLTNVGLRPTEIEFMFQNDAAEALGALSRYIWFSTMDTVRATAVAEIMLALGAVTFAEFPHMIGAFAVKDWAGAVAQLNDSHLPEPGQWGPVRVRAISNMILNGAWQ